MNYISNIYKSITSFKDGYKKSNNKFYFILKHKLWLTAFLAVLTLTLGSFGFLVEGKNIFSSISSAIKMLSLDIPDNYNAFNILLLLASLLAALTVFSAAIFTFFKDFIDRKIAKNIISKEHIAVFGLGEINRAFLGSEFNDKIGIVIVENDKESKYIETYKEMGFGVLIGDILAQKNFNLFDFETTKYAMVALGNDRINIEVAIRIIQTIKENKIKSPTRIIVHIEDKRLTEIFHQNFILPQMSEEIKIDIKTFSFFDECSKNLFDNHSIVGDDQSIISANTSFETVICGNGKLALSVVENILLLSNLPNQNRHTLILLDEHSKKFYEKIRQELNYTPEKFPTIDIKIYNTSYECIEFYMQKIWKSKTLVNAVICYNDEQTNIKIATELYNKIYIRNQGLKTKVLFGMFKEYSLSDLISTNKEAFDRFYTFGNERVVFDKTNLIDEENYKLAQMIHHGYGDEFDLNKLQVDQTKLEERWYKNAKFSDKLSNIAQAKHIDIKLQALGFYKQKSLKSSVELLKINRKVFDEVALDLIKQSDMSYDKLLEYSKELDKFWSKEEYKIKYMPKEYQNIFEKLVRAEHERWNSYHFLNGWEYNHEKDKQQKNHDCLKPLSEFQEPNLQITVIYDIYSIIYLPNYLASTGFEMIKI